MLTSNASVFVQPLVVFRGRWPRFASREPTTGSSTTSTAPTNYISAAYSHAMQTHQPDEQEPLLAKVFSNVPVINFAELAREYDELGVALDQLREFGDGDDWTIDSRVYEAAGRIGSELLANNYPVPRVFSHGPKSVVFNWEKGETNIYLTISADRISALVSTPARIEKRLVYTPDTFISHSRVPLLSHAADLDHPTLVTMKAGSEPLEMVA